MLAGKKLAVVAGRLHLYEGHALADLACTPRALARWGVKILLLTSAVGGIRSDLTPGQLVCITDHINFSGANPLYGPNVPPGTRFPDLSQLYSPRLRALWSGLASGVYAAMPGPSYETPAEIQMLSRLGAAVVGMSLVHEAIAGHHAGLEIAALSVVSNLAAGISTMPLTHEEVTLTSLMAVDALKEALSVLVSQC
jgi:purine-nucleoside phosphorylase